MNGDTLDYTKIRVIRRVTIRTLLICFCFMSASLFCRCGLRWGASEGELAIGHGECKSGLTAASRSANRTPTVRLITYVS